MKFFTARFAAVCRTATLSLFSLMLYWTLKTLIYLDYNDDISSGENFLYRKNDLSVEEIPLPKPYEDSNKDDFRPAIVPKGQGYVYVRTNDTKQRTHAQQEIRKINVPIAYNVACDAERLLHTPRTVQEACTSKICKNITCFNLLHSTLGDPVFDHARRWMEQHKPTFHDSSQLQNQLQKCEIFKHNRRYHLEALSEEEANYPIAFNIIMHKDLDQIEKLLRAIYRPQNIYCIHVDAKSSESLIKATNALANCFSNVFVASKLERIVYAGFSRLQADIDCMKDLVRKDHPWRYLLNLAGQAAPLKSNAELVKILSIYNGSNDIEGIYGNRIHKGRFQNEWLETGVNTSNPRIEKTPDKKNPPPPDDIEIVRGSAYGVFSRAFVEYLLKDEKAQHLLKWSQKTYSPDEHYWATLHHTYSNPHIKSPGSYSGVPNEKPWLAVFAAWGGVDKCHGMWKRGTCVFGVEDLPILVSKREMFANKFYESHQPFALECLNEWIEYKSTCPSAVPFDSSYYKSLPFIRKV